jgi:outer membrane lipoprotein SlyB
MICGERPMKRLSAILCVSLAIAGCNKDSPTAPSQATTSIPTTTTTSIPVPITATVAGVVTDANTRAAIGGMSVTVFGGTYGGRTTTTDGNGYYSIAGVAGTLTLSFAKPGYMLTTRTVTVNGDTRFDTAIAPVPPPFSRSGVGNTVFDMPTSVSRVRITGFYESCSSNFIIRIGGRLVVNELLGRCWDSTRYDGTHLTSGGVVEITNSSGVQWTFTQVQ